MTQDEVRKLQLHDPVTYVPEHLNGNAGHEDAEQGVLISYSMGREKARVLYCKSRKVQLTPIRNLVEG